MNGQAVYIDATTPEGRGIQQRLSDKKILQSLDHLLAKIETLENAVDRLNVVMEQGPGLVSIAADSIDEVYRHSADKGINIEERLTNTLKLVEQLTAPAMVEKLNSLVIFADQAPGLISMITDSLDEAFRTSKASGVDIESKLSATLELANKLTTPEMVVKLKGLIELSEQAPGLISMFIDSIDEEMAKVAETGIDLKALSTLSQKLSKAVTKANKMPKNKLGAFGLFRALRDPDRQKAIGFLMNFTKAFGQEI